MPLFSSYPETLRAWTDAHSHHRRCRAGARRDREGCHSGLSTIARNMYRSALLRCSDEDREGIRGLNKDLRDARPGRLEEEVGVLVLPEFHPCSRLHTYERQTEQSPVGPCGV